MSTLLLILSLFFQYIIGLVCARIIVLDECNIFLYIYVFENNVLEGDFTALSILRERGRETDHCPCGH